MPSQIIGASPNLSSYLKSLKGYSADDAVDQLAAYVDELCIIYFGSTNGISDSSKEDKFKAPDHAP